MATPPSGKLVWQSPYRGGTRLWSNRYYVTGPDWSGSTQFHTWVDAVWGQLQGATLAATTLVEAVAYQGGSDLPFDTYSIGAAGTKSLGTSWRAPLEECLLLKFTTTARSTKNHPIYLFKFIHCVPTGGATSPDIPDSGYVSTATSRYGNFVSGLSDGTNNRILCGPRGAVAQSMVVETYLHHRDFPT